MEDINVDSVKKAVADLFDKWSKNLRGVIPTRDLKTSKLAEREIYIVYKKTDRKSIDQAFIARTALQLDAILTYADKNPINGITKVRLIEKYPVPKE